ncbi:nonribosomal peptide synthetase [Ceratobasidium sp. AG-Ba]|nr:nonribosomal peptide synthetase [Ceratobasidium sp. AG-Ba]QRW11834.1 nonribosomal peptide synthetase [Ceratobasidium sp. AG-Ba]
MSKGTNASTSVTESSGGLSNYTRDELAPYVFNDMRAYQESSVDSFLKLFLEACRQDAELDTLVVVSPAPSPNNAPEPPLIDAEQSGPSVPSHPGDELHSEDRGMPVSDSGNTIRAGGEAFEEHSNILESCLDLVMGLTQDSEMREHIKDFCDLSGKELSRYEPFAALANCALGKLDQLDHTQIPGLHGSSNVKLIFHSHRDRALKSPNGTKFATCMPNLIITSLAAVNRSHNQPGRPYTDALKNANYAKYEAFHFRECLASVEFAWRNQNIESWPPPAYNKQLAEQISPLDLKNLSFYPGSSKASDDTSGDLLPGISSSGSNTNPQSPSLKRIRDMSGSEGHSQQSKRTKTKFSATSKSRRSEKDRNNKLPQAITELAQQIGLNAMAAMQYSFGRRFCLNFAMIDEFLWIWWIDRQGAIQSTGLNLIEDFPRFLVLLFAMQRFTLAGWGYNIKLDPGAHQIHTSANFPTETPPIKLEITDGQSVFLDPNDVIYMNKSLVSRATTVVGASGTVPGADGLRLVGKVSWPNKNRENEFEIIQHARSSGEDVGNYLPRAFVCYELSEHTGIMRLKLGLNQSTRPARVMRILILERLDPIIHLRGEQLFFAWVQCVRVHYVCWKSGVYHQDISLNNLMYRLIDGKPHGTLSDWDLSRTKHSNFTKNNEVTGTVPFLPLTVLIYWANGASHPRNYTSDLESFVWVLLWVLLFVENCKLVSDDPNLRKVQVGDYAECQESKSGLLHRIAFRFIKPKEEWTVCEPLLRWLGRWISAELDRAMEPSPQDVILEDKIISFFTSLEKSKPQNYDMPNTPRIL